MNIGSSPEKRRTGEEKDSATRAAELAAQVATICDENRNVQEDNGMDEANQNAGEVNESVAEEDIEEHITGTVDSFKGYVVIIEVTNLQGGDQGVVPGQNLQEVDQFEKVEVINPDHRRQNPTYDEDNGTEQIEDKPKLKQARMATRTRQKAINEHNNQKHCLLYTSPSPRDA